MSSRDYRRIVEDIQMVLMQSAVTLDVVHAMSVEYAAACDEVNLRLRECRDLLRRGLRGEALQRCELDPNLLDAVTTLDFPELPSWVEVLASQKLVTPPPLLIEVAGELNEAFAVERPLIPILRKHRLLALARAPLKDRIVVLRKLAAIDADVPVWDEDLRNWERVRQEEIHRAASTAMMQKDVERLGEMERELCGGEWREAPKAELVRKVSGMAAELRMRQAREVLQTLLPQLTAAYQEFDVDLGRSLRSQWKAHAAVAGLAPSDELWQLAAPCLAWLEGEDRKDAAKREYAAAEGRLVQALDDDKPPQELERRYGDLLRLEQGVNDQLSARFLTRMEQYRLAASRKHRLILTGLAAGLLIATGLTVTFVMRSQRASEVASHVKALTGLLDEEELPEAGEFIKGLEAKPDHVKKDAKILELVARYGAMNQAEADRRDALRDALMDVERSVSGKPTIPTLESGRRMLNGLKPRAVTEAEQDQIAQLEADLAAKIRGIEADNAAAYGKQVEALREKAARLEGSDAFDGNRLQAAQETLAEAKRLVDAGSGLPPALVKNAEFLQAKVAAVVTAEIEELRHTTMLREITEAVGSPKRFCDALSKYSEAYQDTKQRAQDFAKVVEGDTAAWELAASWNAFMAKRGKLNVTTFASADAGNLATEIKAFLVHHGGFPAAESLRTKIPHLEARAQRNGPSGPLADTLSAVFKDFTVADLYFVREKDGTSEYNYYSTEPLKLPDGELSAMPFQYIAYADRSVPTKLKSLKRSQVAVFKNSLNVDAPVIGPAPQSVFAADAVRQLRAMREGGWESTFERIILDLDAHRFMDPVVKVQLLTYLLSVASQGSSELQGAFKTHLGRLQGIASDMAVTWIDPHDAKAAFARKTAQSMLAEISPELPKAFDEMKKALVEAAQPTETSAYEWIGWLQLGATGKWTCSFKAPSPNFDAELCLIVPAAAANGVQIETIGNIRQGTIQLNTSSPGFLEGRPVFAVRKDAK